MTTAQVVETSVTVNNNSPIQDYVQPDDQTQPTFEMTPGFKPFTVKVLVLFMLLLSKEDLWSQLGIELGTSHKEGRAPANCANTCLYLL